MGEKEEVRKRIEDIAGMAVWDKYICRRQQELFVVNREKLLKVMENATDQQIEIVSCIPEHNIMVNAVPGSGKTSLLLFMAKQHPSIIFHVITYNKHL